MMIFTELPAVSAKNVQKCMIKGLGNKGILPSSHTALFSMAAMDWHHISSGTLKNPTCSQSCISWVCMMTEMI